MGDILYRIISYLILSVCLHCYTRLLLTAGCSPTDRIEEIFIEKKAEWSRLTKAYNGLEICVFWMSKK